MKIHLLVVGTRPPAWVATGFEAYAKRLPAQCALHLVEIPTPSRKQGEVAKLRKEEGQQLLRRAPKDCYVVALSERGKTLSTRQLAQTMQEWMHEGRDAALLVGGADGLSQDCLQRADECWSLSALTFPHALVRVIVAEQIYRAWSIVTKHPYHRE